MAKKKVAVASSRAKANKKALAKTPKASLKKTRLKPKAYAAQARIPLPGTDYAIWDISFWHYDDVWNYYYPVYDDQIDPTLDLYIMGEASPSDFADTDILAKVDRLSGVPLLGEAPAPHFSPSYYPSSWVATVAKNTLSASTSYIVKVRQYQDKAAASSEFSTLAASPTAPPVRPDA
jgi:hypothetical protein